MRNKTPPKSLNTRNEKILIPGARTSTFVTAYNKSPRNTPNTRNKKDVKIKSMTAGHESLLALVGSCETRGIPGARTSTFVTAYNKSPRNTPNTRNKKGVKIKSMTAGHEWPLALVGSCETGGIPGARTSTFVTAYNKAPQKSPNTRNEKTINEPS